MSLSKLFLFLISFLPLGAFGDIISSDLRQPATQVFIPLLNNQLPAAADLLYVDKNGSHVLTTGELIDLQKKKTDLSAFDPDPTLDVWNGPSSADDEKIDEALPINSGDLVTFSSVPVTSKPRFKINVQVPLINGSTTTLTILISRDLHTFLLRKELLRRLGYAIPAMKYVPKVRIKFNDTVQQNVFIREGPLSDISPHILGWTGGKSERWCTVAPQVLKNDPKFPCKVDPNESDPLVIGFQDVIVAEPESLHPDPHKDIPVYNLAMDPPVDPKKPAAPETQRIYRSLAVMYDLVNFPESINQTEWYAGRAQNDVVTFPLPEAINFGCTRDDAVWAIRRMGALSRQDIEQIVAKSYFPEPVAKVVAEKIIARRNSLNSLFGLNTAEMPFDSKVTDLPAVKDGKIIQIEWPGYASNFAHGDFPSPIKGLKYFFIAQLESNILDAGIDKLNEEIPNLEIANQTKNHFKDIVKKLNSGQISTIPLRKVWVKPIVGGGLVVSRDVVIGNYLGTNNPIQLADSIGLTMNAGITGGVDGIVGPYGITGTAQATASLVLTRIKPLKLLKQGVDEPKKNIIVPLVFRGASGVLDKAFEDQEKDKDKTPAQMLTDLNNNLETLQNYLAEGESLIVTESVQGAETLTGSASVQVPWSPAVAVTAGPNQGLVHRIQIYRKDINTIQVFVDNGGYVGLNISCDFTTGIAAQFPVISITGKKTKGEARSRIFNVNITPTNPNIKFNLKGLAQVLKTGSTEFLEENKDNTPAFLKVKFNDSTNSFQFLSYVHRHLKLNGDISVQLPDGQPEKYISLSDGSQSGMHYQLFVTQAVTYLIQRLSGDGTYGFNTVAAPNPGHSLLGSSKTRDVDFQTYYSSKGMDEKFVRIQYRWEGWSKNVDDVMNIVNNEMNPRYGIKFYDDQALHDVSKIQLYQLTTNFNVYQKAIDRLLALSPTDEKELETKFYNLHGCARYIYQMNTMNNADKDACAALNKFEDAFRNLRHNESDPMKFSKNIQELVGNFERFAPLQDMIAVFGGVQNIFINAVIQGYRVGLELESKPLYSGQSIGQQDNFNPTGVADSLEKTLQINDGEFYIQWLRDVL